MEEISVRKKLRKRDKWGRIRYKQANNIYIAPKSKIESRAHYAPGARMEHTHSRKRKTESERETERRDRYPRCGPVV